MDVKRELQGTREKIYDVKISYYIPYLIVSHYYSHGCGYWKTENTFNFFLLIFACFFPTRHFRVDPIFSFIHVYEDERGFRMSCLRILIQDPRHCAAWSFISPSSSSIFTSPSNCSSTSSSTSVSVSVCVLLRSPLNLWGRFFKASNVPGNTGGSPVAFLTATSNWWDVWRWWRGGKRKIRGGRKWEMRGRERW